jgi:uronate dehydrogenase
MSTQSLRQKTVLLAGATGRIGRVLRKYLRDEYRLVLFNRSKVEDLGPNERLIQGDVTEAEAIEKAAQGVDVIVDMAAIATIASFRDKLYPVNILGSYNIFEAARKAGISRLIYASTHHAMGRYPAGQMIDEKMPYRPDSMYGVTKCFSEAMGRFYAEKAGFSVICLRIGAFQERPRDERHLAVWISHRDMVQLIRRCIEAPNVQFEIFYGVSNNTRGWWDISRAREVLGYEPEDDAEEYAAELLQEPAEEWMARVKYHGGDKVDVDFMP